MQSQEEVDSAIETLYTIAQGICDTTLGILDYRRVDLALDFHCQPEAIIAAHRNCSYPRTRCAKRREFSESSASWDYVGRRFTFYDKGREQSMRGGGDDITSDVLRVEIQLTRDPLKRLLGHGGGSEYPDRLDFDRAYQVYRSELLKFAPPREVTVAHTKYEALAMLDREGHRVSGRLPSEIFTDHMTPSTRRRWKRLVAQAHVTSVAFDWADRLPVNGPPPFLET